MDSFEKKIKRATLKIRMHAAEKADVRDRVRSFMEYHPAAMSVLQKRRTTGVRIPYAENFSFIYFKKWHLQSAAGVALLLLVVGLPALAENTVPGDVLYAMKVRVNEEVLSQLSFTPYEKVRWETRRVERRIAEARQLAQAGKLTDAVEAQITKTVQEHAATAQKELVAMRENDIDGAAVAQIAIDSSFDVQSAVLDTANASSSPGNQQILALAGVVRGAKATLAPGADEPASLTSYERFYSEVDTSMTQARTLFESIKGSIGENDQNDIVRRLEDVDRRISGARAAYDASSTEVAISGLKNALGDIQKITSFMSDIDLRNVVSLETLVPKKLSIDERIAAVGMQRDTLQRDLAELVERITADHGKAMENKFGKGVDEINARIVIMGGDLSVEETLENAERARDEAQAYFADVIKMAEGLKIPAQSDTVIPAVGTSTSTPAASSTPPVTSGTTTKKVAL